MHELSVVIITLNEEKNIATCIESVRQVANEIVVLDSYSTDKTIDIARKEGAVVYQQEFKGYGLQKNAALQHSSFDFVLSLDADEVLNSALVKAILYEKKFPSADAYIMNRCNNYCGKFIRHGSWYPDKKIRLFNKRIGKWSNDLVHEKIEISSEAKIKELKGDILHYSYLTIAEHIAQNNKFSTLSSESLFKKGRRTNIFKVIVNPVWAFFLSYFMRAGFVDGFYGFVIAVNISHLTFLKHAKLMMLQRSKNV
jgi:glycosyltransferase involved in cell wall biosynthesis